MEKKFLSFSLAIVGALLLTATNGFSFNSFGNAVNNACAPEVVYTGDCALCHVSDRSQSTPAKDAAGAGGSTLTDFFCLPTTTPTCTDNDNDTYFVEGGDCGPVDCNDDDPAINPGVEENCSDNIDNNCNGLIDDMDPVAVGCLVCTDNDGDSFASEGGDCGPVDCDDSNAAINPNASDIPNNGIDENCSGADSVDPTALDNDGDGYIQADDCNDTDPTINPGAIDIPNNNIDENCDGVDEIDNTTLDNDGDGFSIATGDCDDTDGAINPDALEICGDEIDNDCNGLVDTQDSNGIDCPVTCIDVDGDTYAIDGGDCGPVDCNDNDATINPSAQEVCGDNIDNDCDDEYDEGCDTSCPDLDGDGYQDAVCGGMDCNDNDAAINPGAAEVCGNGYDENCNGTSDDTCLTCPDGTLLVVRKVKYNRGDRKLHLKGRATRGTTISVVNADTQRVLAEGIRTDKGKWEAEIKRVSRSIRNITVISSNGCSVDKKVKNRKNRKKNDDRDEREDDDDRDDD